MTLANVWGDVQHLGEANAGVSVTPDTALTNSAVFACVRVLAETLASLPLITYERQGKSRRRATEFYLYPILHDEPNEWMTSFEFRETVQGHLALWGNAYSQVDYDDSGRITSIFPLRPDKMQRIEIENGEKRYLYQLPSNEIVWLPGLNIWHLKAFGDGTFGYSPIDLMKNGIGLAMALEKYGSKFFGNGSRPGGVLEHPGKLGTDAQTRLRESWAEMHSGLDNAHKVAILEEGLKWHEVGIPPEHAQFLETRKFQVTDIARMFRIQPHKIADLERSTNNNIEHQGLEFVTDTMMPWFTRWEQSIKKYLMLPGERERYYVEFLVDGLLRGDIATRTQYYATGKQWGWLSTNDIREKENMNPIDGGDEYLVPNNMMPFGEENSSTVDETSTRDGKEKQVPAEEPEENKNRHSFVSMNRRSVELRANKKDIALRRLHVAQSYIGVLQDAAERSLNREARDIKDAAKKYIGKGDIPGFSSWKADYYNDLLKTIEKMWSPAFYGLGKAINAAAAREVDGPVGLTPGLDECLKYHLERAISRSIVISNTSLDTLLQKGGLDNGSSRAVTASGSDEIIIEEIKDMVDSWPIVRAENFAKWESTRISGLMTKATYFYNEVSEMQWIQLDNNPFCKKLDGETLEMGHSCRSSFWLEKMAEVEADSTRSKVLQTSWNVSTPPLFLGCECQIVASKKREKEI